MSRNLVHPDNQIRADAETAHQLALADQPEEAQALSKLYQIAQLVKERVYQIMQKFRPLVRDVAQTLEPPEANKTVLDELTKAILSEIRKDRELCRKIFCGIDEATQFQAIQVALSETQIPNDYGRIPQKKSFRGMRNATSAPAPNL